MTDPFGPVNQTIPPHNPAMGAPRAQKTSGLAITGLVLGIFGLCFFPLSIAALVLGIVALTQIADPARALTGRGMALTSTILGGLGITLVPVVLMIGILLPALGAARNSAMNAVDLSNLRQIGMYTSACANDNGDILPDHPRDLASYIGGPLRDIFISPFHNPNTVLDRGDSDGTAVRYGSYIFLLPGAALEDIEYPSQTVLAYTAKVSDIQDQRSVLFSDGHVERWEDKKLRESLPPKIDVDALDGP